MQEMKYGATLKKTGTNLAQWVNLGVILDGFCSKMLTISFYERDEWGPDLKEMRIINAENCFRPSRTMNEARCLKSSRVSGSDQYSVWHKSRMISSSTKENSVSIDPISVVVAGILGVACISTDALAFRGVTKA